MASNLPPNVPSSKTTNAPQQNFAPLAPQINSSSSSDIHRRPGGSGSFGAGASTRSGGGVPRNKQISKNQHKQSRRYKLTDEDVIAESAAMRSTNSRKGQTSITHLMNFSLPPRPTYFQQHFNQHHRHIRRNPTWGMGSGYHAIDKARYVHANYRFVVDPRGDYYAQSVDADIYLDWNNILQILASPQSQAAACPICLGDPVAPRMAKCGHIFCLHCLIRYMHSTEETDRLYMDKRSRWKKCPICWDSVYMSETRPVRWYTGQEGPLPREGEDVCLRLVVRPAGHTLALPRETSTLKEEDIPWHFAADVMDYARVMKGTEHYMISQFDEEIDQLEQLEKHDELMFGEDTEWTGRAIRAVNDLKDRVKGIGNPQEPETPVEKQPKRKAIVFNDSQENVPAMYSVQHAAKSGQSSSDSPSVTGQNLSQTKPGSPTDETSLATSSSSTNTSQAQINPSNSALSQSIAQFRSSQGNNHAPSDYYFYQALLHYYLSPLDIRILKAAFGEYSLFPSTILPRVERVSTGHIVDDELRKRAKYLAHLPYGCEVNFLECDWTDTVPSDTLNKFKSDIERRRKRNIEKETKEEKDRAKAEKEEEDKKYAALRRKRPSFSEEKWQPQDFKPLVASEGNEAIDSLDSGRASTSPLWNARPQNGSSFASLASPSTSPSASRTVWGTAVVAPMSPVLQAAPPEAAPADDGWLQGWEKDLLQEDDLVAQVEAASIDGKATGKTTSNKKKKAKKITLMSTNARRGA